MILAYGCVRHTPFNSPLLDTNDTSSNLRRCQFSKVDQNLRASNTDSDTADNTTNNEMRNVLSRALKNSTNNPEKTSNHERLATTKTISDSSCGEGTDTGSCRHRSCDTALGC